MEDKKTGWGSDWALTEATGWVCCDAGRYSRGGGVPQEMGLPCGKLRTAEGGQEDSSKQWVNNRGEANRGGGNRVSPQKIAAGSQGWQQQGAALPFHGSQGCPFHSCKALFLWLSIPGLPDTLALV